MNKTAIKNFAIWARKKLITEISYKAGLLGITDKEIKSPLPQSTRDVEFYDIGTKEPYSISGIEIEQRRKLAEVIQERAERSDYMSAYNNVIEEVAYTWFNRLIAVRFMEVNDYLPSRVRVLSSDSNGKSEPDLVTSPFDADLEYSQDEKEQIIKLKNNNELDKLFQMLFIKQCNALNAILPELFEQTSDYTELLLNVSFTDQEGVVYHLVHDIPENDFNMEKEGQVEIIGWLYQYYNTELNELVYDGNLSKNRIPKELLPAATTIYTPDWAIRYMVENSLGRLWLQKHPNSELKSAWRYFLEEAEQEPKVQAQLNTITEDYRDLKPEEIKVIDPCMGSGHILVYAFDVLMMIYESCGYSQRDAAKSIIENNLYGLDIDNRAYQLAYFAVMMKARQYNRRILDSEVKCHIFSINESNEINQAHLKYFGKGMSELERNTAMNQFKYLIDNMIDAKEYGSILKVDNLNWKLLYQFIDSVEKSGQISMDSLGLEDTLKHLRQLVETGKILAQKYEIVITNPPYLGSTRYSPKLSGFVNVNYSDVKSDLSMVMFKRAIDGFAMVNGYISFITTTSWMFLKSFEDLREFVFQNTDLDSLVDFGTELFEGKVGHNPIVAWVTRNRSTGKKITAIRLVDFCYSRRAEKEPEFFNIANRYYPQQQNFYTIPGKPIAYWVPKKILSLYNYPLINSKFVAKEGVGTRNDDVFLKMHWEVAANSIGKEKRWILTDKAGAYRKWYLGPIYVMDWENDGYRIKNYRNDDGSLRSRPQNLQYLFKRGISWGKVGSGVTSFRLREEGYGFNDAAPTLFGNNEFPLLGVLNSKIFTELLKIRGETLNVTCGVLEELPLLGYCEGEIQAKIEEIVQNSLNISKLEWDFFETSWNFNCHPFFVYRTESGLLADAYTYWERFSDSQFIQLKANEEELNRILIDLYDLNDELDSKVEDKDVTIRKADLGRDVRSFLSYAVGCMFGRYSLDVDGLAYAGGEWDSSKYKTFIPDKDNVIPITDEEYFEDDIVGLFCAFLKKTFGEETLEENLDFIAKALGNKGNTSREVIRNYFLKDFFKDHCKIYQKRPIYWLFDSGKADGFKALVYMHRYNADTIGNLRIDYLHRMQRVYDSEIARMQETIDNSGNAREVAAATKRKEKLTKQLKETKEYDEKIAHLALARKEIDLDDGVKVNYEKVQMAGDGKKYEILAKI